MMDTYQGILFPDRAESLEDYRAYRVFLEHWDDIAVRMRSLYEGVSLRRETKILAIHGEQGTGKTLLARRLFDDYSASRQHLKNNVLNTDDSNFWHRVTGSRPLSLELIRQATQQAKMKAIDGNKDWLGAAKTWMTPLRGHPCILIADNAERLYFRQSLVDIDDAEFVQLGEKEETIKLAGQNLVAACREDLRGCLFVLLTNDELFLLQLHEAIEAQHANLMEIVTLPLPDGPDKEAVIRVNTNRLNPISYWHCIDKAGPTHKVAVRRAIVGASSFPESFRAVDQAIINAPASRQGRRAKKNQISLVVLTPTREGLLNETTKDEFGPSHRTEYGHDWAEAVLYDSAWAGACLEDAREASLLESEWNLRIVVLGDPFVASLLTDDSEHQDVCRSLLEFLKPVMGPGTWTATRDARAADFQELVSKWPDTTAISTDEFWKAGQQRASQYETRLRQLLPGYDTGGESFLGYRPDYIVEPFVPCAVTSAMYGDSDEISRAIQRKAHVLEFTAQENPSTSSIQAYLASKLSNYVRVTQDQ